MFLDENKLCQVPARGWLDTFKSSLSSKVNFGVEEKWSN